MLLNLVPSRDLKICCFWGAELAFGLVVNGLAFFKVGIIIISSCQVILVSSYQVTFYVKEMKVFYFLLSTFFWLLTENLRFL